MHVLCVCVCVCVRNGGRVGRGGGGSSGGGGGAVVMMEARTHPDPEAGATLFQIEHMTHDSPTKQEHTPGAGRKSKRPSTGKRL